MRYKMKLLHRSKELIVRKSYGKVSMSRSAELLKRLKPVYQKAILI